MPEDLVGRIKKDLATSGFGSEMRAIRAFLDAGWKARGGASYQDLDERRSREVDLVAYCPRNLVIESGGLELFMHVVAEVKKSSKPWVVFKHHPDPRLLKEGWSNLIYASGLPCRATQLTDDISWGARSLELGWLGYGIHESFKKPNKRSRSFRGFTTAYKAALHVLASERDDDPRGEAIDIRVERCRMVWVRPMLILDGPLVSAELSDDGELIVEHIEEATFDFSFTSPGYPNDRSVPLDLVTLAALPRAIDRLASRQENAFAAVLREAGLTPPAARSNKR